MYAIYGNIYHQYTPMLAYIPYMDPMGYVNVSTCRNIIFKLASWDVAEMLKISQWL